jgi:hypothetical protein
MDGVGETCRWGLIQKDSNGKAVPVLVHREERELAPYAAMLVLPGGLLALLWWKYLRKKNDSLVAT